MPRLTVTLLTGALFVAVSANSAWGLGLEATLLPGSVKWEYLTEDGAAVGIDETSGAIVSRQPSSDLTFLRPPTGRKWTSILSHANDGWLLAQSVAQTDRGGGMSAEAYAGQLTRHLQQVSNSLGTFGDPLPASASRQIACPQDCDSTEANALYGGKLWSEVYAIGGDGTITGITLAKTVGDANVPNYGKELEYNVYRVATDGTVEFAEVAGAFPQRVGPAHDVLLAPGLGRQRLATLDIWQSDGSITAVELPDRMCPPPIGPTFEGWLTADGMVAGNATVSRPIRVDPQRPVAMADCAAQPFLWSGQGPAEILASLPGFPYATLTAVNDHGSMVGFAAQFNTSDRHMLNGPRLPNRDTRAVRWTSSKAATDLNSEISNPDAITGFTLTDAYSINQNGDILAHAETRDGGRATVLLRNRPS